MYVFNNSNTTIQVDCYELKSNTFKNFDNPTVIFTGKDHYINNTFQIPDIVIYITPERFIRTIKRCISKESLIEEKKMFNSTADLTYDENTGLNLPWCVYDRVRYFHYIWNEGKQRYESEYLKYLPLVLQKEFEI